MGEVVLLAIIAAGIGFWSGWAFRGRYNGE
jgi:hypothetical protein